MPSHRRMRWLTATGAILTLGLPSRANQFVTCAASTWMNNKFGESPCTVALRLAQECGEDLSGSVLPLDSSMRTYRNPVGGGQCTCNTVMFNLLNACAICQGGHSSSYAQWTASCQAVHLDFPDQVATRSINVPEWAFINVSEHSTFNLLAARDVAGEGNDDSGSNGWTPLQIVLPIVIAVVVATVAAVLFYFYRRRLKQRYILVADSSPTTQMGRHPSSHSHYPSYPHSHSHSHHPAYSRPQQPHIQHAHSQATHTHTSKPSHHRIISEPTGTQHPSRYNTTFGSTSSLGLDRLFPEQQRRVPAWEQAHMTSPRRFGGLLPDRPRVHERTRGPNWSIDADVGSGVIKTERKSESRSRSGSPIDRNKESSSPFPLKEARASLASLASKLSRNSGNGHVRSESQLGLITNVDFDSPTRANPNGNSSSGRGALAGIMNGLNSLTYELGISKRPPPVAVVSSPPRRGFNLDDVDSERSPQEPVSAGSCERENPFASVKGKDNPPIPSDPAHNGVPTGSGPSWSSADTSRTDVMLISRSPGQDFNSMISPIESDGFGAFHASSETDYFPAPLSDDSSLEPGLYRVPPPSNRSGGSPSSPSPPSRILIPASNSTNALLVPPVVRAAGGFLQGRSPSRTQIISPSSGGVGSAVLPNDRLFSTAVSEGDVEPPSALTFATTPTANSAHPTNSEHSSSYAYTVPNPFIYDERHGGTARAMTALQLTTSASPLRRNVDLDLAS